MASASATAHADLIGGAWATRTVERADSIGAVTGVSWDGEPSAGITGRIGLTERIAIGAMVRARGDDVVPQLDAIWQLTHGKLAATYGDRPVYPIRLELVAGVAVVDPDGKGRRAAGTFGVTLRVRASTRLSIDVSLRDEISRADRPYRFVHVPELQLAVSWTAPHQRLECHYVP
jgi:hypothetical protein